MGKDEGGREEGEGCGHEEGSEVESEGEGELCPLPDRQR